MEERKIRTSLGKFDFLKGIAILAVVFSHCLGPFDFSSRPRMHFFLNSFCYPAAYGTFLCFFIICGYFFRERDPKTVFLSELKAALKPYLSVFAVGLAAHFLIQILFYDYSFRLFLRVLLGFLFGFWESTAVFGIEIYPIGPIWFLLANFWCLLFLSLVLKFIPSKWRVPVVLFLCICGSSLSALRIQPPFCIREGLTYLPFSYFGVLLRKKKYLQKAKKRQAIVVFLTAFFATILSGLLLKESSMALQPLLMALWAGAFFLMLSVFPQGDCFFTNAIAFVGRYSFWIFCVHSVEEVAFSGPRYNFSKSFSSRQLAGAFLLFLIRILIIAAGCGIVFLCGKAKEKRSSVHS